MSIITAENISKGYGDKVLFNNLSLSINDEKVGLIGINGIGKSTLLKIIAGHEISETGTIKKTNGMRIEYLPQNPNFNGDATVLEQVYKSESPIIKTINRYHKVLLQMDESPQDVKVQNEFYKLTDEMNSLCAWDMESQIKTILTKLGISDFYAKINTLSGGQKKRTALAGALVSPCDLLILDEPTNHLDSKMIDWLESHIKSRKGSLLMITHDRYFLDRAVNRIIELDNGNLYSYEGNYTYYIEKKIERQDIESSLERKKNNLFKKELDWIRKGAKARTTKQKARIQRFEELRDTKVSTDEANLEMTTAHTRLGNKIIEISNVTKVYDDKIIIQDYSYMLQRTDRIGIIGDNGAGKSTLINLITGKIAPDKGFITIGETVKLGYFDQHSEDMDISLRAIDYIKQNSGIVTTADGTQISAAKMMEKFLFSPSLQYSIISKLSGGERRRLYLMRILMGAPNVLILDEPTNDLDIDTLKVLENYLDDFSGPIIAVSHDRYFLDRICNKILDCEGNGKVVQYTGNYFEYRESQGLYEVSDNNKLINNIKNDKKTSPLESTDREKRIKRKFTYNEQKEYDSIDIDLLKLENELEHVDLEITNNVSDFVKLEVLIAKKELLEEELIIKMERQEYLCNLDREMRANS
ncbi:ATP-binding cassette domain-containing protein [Alkalibaculum sp. M08DMB]|uniref:ATP-binding cassette domain-containing protein n=1 Tax=Alkalibaculum sporogenes TaxID=2655001 RepID=A0A6A7K7X9_9FIRM|nr:ATP-binding cassette domain-containing protein [Alkalibaculum sporogenes]